MRMRTTKGIKRHVRCYYLLMALGLLLCVGCATVGREFAVEYVPDVKIGKTTQQEIRQMFGSPWRIGTEDGKRTWTYGRYNYRLFGNSSTKDLVIRFTDKGVVESYTYNTTDHQE